MKRVTTVCAVSLLLAACDQGDWGEGPELRGTLDHTPNTPEEEPGVRSRPKSEGVSSDVAGELVDAKTAFEDDVKILAEEKGLGVDSVRESMLFQTRFAQYVEGVLARSPHRVAAVWVDSVPATTGHVVLVGDTPEWEQAQTMAGVTLSGGARYSLEQQYERVRATSASLTSLGFPNHSTYYDHKKQTIRVSVEVGLDDVPVTSDELAEAISELEEPRRSVRPEDFDIQLGNAIFTPDASRGGNWLRDDGARECSSAWSVTNGSVNGIATAAHCNGLNQFEEPGEAPYAMSFGGQVSTYSDGDVEWHTTVQPELGKFYATATAIRSVTAYRPTSTMVGQSVCHYGRASNNRTCNHEVAVVNGCYQASAPINGTVCNVARTDSPNNNIDSGDSGGGWSFGTVAFGVHSSSVADAALFTPVEELQDALGVALLGGG